MNLLTGSARKRCIVPVSWFDNHTVLTMGRCYMPGQHDSTPLVPNLSFWWTLTRPEDTHHPIIVLNRTQPQ